MSEPGILNQVLGERYRVEREIGRGGMATVYLAHDLRHDVQVAIKLLRRELAPHLAGQRFTREIQITARLRHPNILAVFDSGEYQGVPFFVMPYVEGETLADRIARDGPLPVGEAATIAAEVADALAHAHEHGVVHRDVKPGNILLSGGHALLADFGIARATEVAGPERLTETGLALGTVHYMSPEQGAGVSIDARSDIYSLGCVLYEMLAGGPPFTGSHQVVLARHAADSPPALRTIRSTMPPALEQAVFRAMAKLPADRFASAAEFRDALRQALTTEHAIRPAPTRRRYGVLIGGGLAAALIGIVALSGLFGQPGAAATTDCVMVFPLAVAAGYPGPASIGEDVSTMIGSALDGAGALRWIDGWPLLAPEQRQDVRTLSLATAHELAASRGCEHFLWGRVTARPGDSAEVALDLYATGDQAIPGSASDRGPVADAWRTGLTAVNELLPRLLDDTETARAVVAEWHDRNPAAMASFLLGEAEFRRARKEAALEQYRAAVAADSSFAWAAIRGAQAASWSHQPEEAASLIRLAGLQPLAPRYAEFVRGYRFHLEGRGDSAAAALTRVTELDPTMTAAWLQLGETYIHLLTSVSNPDSAARLAFLRAYGTDTTATILLYHALEAMYRLGQADEAAPLLSSFLSAQPDSGYAEQLRLMDACVRRGPGAVDWDAAAATRPLRVVLVGFALAGRGARLDCTEAALRAVMRVDTGATPEADGRRYYATAGLAGAMVAQDRVPDAIATIDAAIERWGFGTSIYLHAAPVVEGFRERARAAAERDAQATGADYARTTWGHRLAKLGILEAHTGDLAVAEAVAGELAGRAVNGTSLDSLYASAVRAHVTLARGDTAGAIARFDSLLARPATSAAVDWDEHQTLALERILLARLLAARGDHAGAIRVANTFDAAAPATFIMFLAPSLRIRADAAAALGDHRAEEVYLARLAALQVHATVSP